MSAARTDKLVTEESPLCDTAAGAFCEAPHFQYIVSGEMKIVTADGAEHMMRAGDIAKLEAGHDAWVVGSQPVIVVDFQGMVDYAKNRK